jgi:TetR/AcrR family transcriptional regulator, transcriptional repressor for nem operon
MGRPSLREKILTEGLKVVHERGFGAASVRDIVRAAGVPQGSFTNHFASKEAFGLAILNLYFENAQAKIDATLKNDDRPPLERIGAYIDMAIAPEGCEDPRNGCLVGNFSAEVVEQSEILRLRLVEILAETRAAIAYALDAAVEAGDLPKGFDVAGVAEFILSGLQGAVLVAKAERDCGAVHRFKDMLFRGVLR